MIEFRKLNTEESTDTYEVLRPLLGEETKEQFEERIDKLMTEITDKMNSDVPCKSTDLVALIASHATNVEEALLIAMSVGRTIGEQSNPLAGLLSQLGGH